MRLEKIKYTDYNGNQREEKFYFNLNNAEITEMDLGIEGGLKQKIEKITETQNSREIVTFFKEFVLKSFGVKSDDGRRFIKSPELSKEFSETEAYNILFMELATNSKHAADFINDVIPHNTNDKAVVNDPKLVK